MTKTSPRPRRTIAAAFVAALLLGSCSTFTSSSSAFSIDGENYSKDDLNGLVDNLIVANQLTAPGGVAAAKDLVAIVSVMVQYRAGSHVLKENGGSVTEAARSAAAAQLELPVCQRVAALEDELIARGHGDDDVSALARWFNDPVPPEPQA